MKTFTPAQRRAAVLLGYTYVSDDCGCVTAEDLGVPPEIAPLDMIAYVDPECSKGHMERGRA